MSGELPTSKPERLQKVLSRAGVTSRRTAEALILAGRVRVNGKVVTELGTKVVDGRDKVEVDGTGVAEQHADRQTWAIHKPAGMLTTLRDPQGRPTIRTLVADLPTRLYPVGRLDWDAEGLLLMSNDGALTHRLTHPKFEVQRTYLAVVKGAVTAETVEKLCGVVELEDGPVTVLYVDAVPGPRRSKLTITVAEGRNHLVKRLCAFVGHEVEKLVRLSYGGIELGDLPARGRRLLSQAEVAKLEAATGGAKAGPGESAGGGAKERRTEGTSK